MTIWMWIFLGVVIIAGMSATYALIVEADRPFAAVFVAMITVQYCFLYYNHAKVVDDFVEYILRTGPS